MTDIIIALLVLGILTVLLIAAVVPAAREVLHEQISDPQ